MAVDKALAAKKAVSGATAAPRKTKVHLSTKFRRPKTLKRAPQPKYPRRSVSSLPRMDDYKLIIRNVNSESATQKIESENTLVLQVHISADKKALTKAVKTVLGADAEKVRTMICPDGSKKAFVKLTAEHDALDVASRAGYV